MILTIGGKDYTIEYSFEAAEYKDCVDTVFRYVTGAVVAETESMIEATSLLLTGIPNACKTLLYAGLLEHNPVADETEAKKLMHQYMKEHKDEETATYTGFYEMLKTQMEKDGFFKLTGLDKILESMTEAEKEEAKPKKIPQDHKRKATMK